MNKDYRKLTELRNWDKNPRSIKRDKFEELKKRITKRGQIKPLIITPDGEVLGGNMRLRAMQELGIKEAWVSVVEPTSEADKIEIALTDNEEMGYYEDQALAELIAQYKDEIDLSKYSVHLKEPQTLEEILKQFSPDEVVEDEVPEVQDEAISKLGEVYQLGRHYVMCGDSTKIEDVEKLMGEQLADLVLTDPPYNMGYTGSATSRRTAIANDKISNFQQFVNDFMSAMITFVKSSAPYYVFTCEEEIPTIKNGFINNGLKPHQVLIWKKQRAGFGGSDFQHQYETFVYGWKSHSDRYMAKDRTLSDVWEFDRPVRSELHPTMKPIALLGHALNSSSKTDDIVMDSFLGSGSTLIACEQTNRICYGMELDPKYVDVIRKRYAKFIDPENWEDNWQSMTPVTMK